MGEGTQRVTLPPPGKFLEEINYQEIIEGEVKNYLFSSPENLFSGVFSWVKLVKKSTIHVCVSKSQYRT